MVHHFYLSFASSYWMFLETWSFVLFLCARRRSHYCIRVDKGENFIQLCEHTCIVRVVLMSYSLSKRVCEISMLSEE